MMGLPAGTSSPITSNDEFYAFAEEETCRNITLGGVCSGHFQDFPHHLNQHSTKDQSRLPFKGYRHFVYILNPIQINLQLRSP